MVAHKNESHTDSAAALNWLRAGVLGANDGIVSVSCLLLGVIAAGVGQRDIILVGVAAIVSGAVSMALGEYVSVSAQRDSERRFIEKEQQELDEIPEEELAELAGILEGYGIEPDTARQAAAHIHARDPLTVHLCLELGIDPEELTNPWAAAGSSAAAFVAGALLPLLAALWAGGTVVAAVALMALALTGLVSAMLAGTSRGRSIVRLVLGGAVGLAITYGAGVVFGA